MGSLVRLIPLVPIAAAAILAQDPNRISYINESLRNLLSEAYSVRLFQVFGPASIDTERFDIVATLPPNSTVKSNTMIAVPASVSSDRIRSAIVPFVTVRRAWPLFVDIAAPGLPAAAAGVSFAPDFATVRSNTENSRCS